MTWSVGDFSAGFSIGTEVLVGLSFSGSLEAFNNEEIFKKLGKQKLWNCQ